jgi:8-oxo-dGTP diphosphatase
MQNPPEIDKIAYIRTENGKVLMSLSKGKTKYYLPGGKREIGETDEETLIREISEEINVNIIPSSIQYVGTFKAQADGKAVGVIVKMTCYRADFEGDMKPCNEIGEIKWLNFSDIDSVAEVDKIIFPFLKEEGSLQ